MDKKGVSIAIEKLVKILIGLMVLWVIYYIIKNVILAGETFLGIFD